MKKEDLEKLSEEISNDADRIMENIAKSPTAKIGEEAAKASRQLFSRLMGSETELTSEEIYKRLVGGRPSLDPNAEHGAHSKKIGVRLPQKEVELLDKLAAENNVKRSQIIREAIDQYLSKKVA